MRRRTLSEIRTDAHLLASCHNIDEVCKTIYVSKNEVLLNILHPKYSCFQLRKPNGNLREIEAPAEGLKSIQKQLNYFLQALYFEHQTSASHGYLICPKNEKSQKNILKNAESHLGNSYMLNADFKDFFHQIKLNDVVTIFSGQLLDFNQKDAFALAKLCVYKNHLPMGAPTSPVLSNLYAIPLDNDIQQWADSNQITYTRFVDDLTFSSDNEVFSQKHLDDIVQICSKYSLKLNDKKTSFKDPSDKKMVTGLILNQTVDIPPEFYNQLNKDLFRLKAVYEASILTRQLEHNNLLDKFKQEVQGQVNFIGMVEGYSNPEFRKYRQLFQQTFEVDDELFSKRWTSFSYI